MTDVELRIEILKLCHRHDRPTAEIVARASELETFVISSRPMDTRGKNPSRIPKADKERSPV